MRYMMAEGRRIIAKEIFSFVGVKEGVMNFKSFLERRVNAFTCISEFIFFQRPSLHFTTKGFNNLDSEEKQTSAVPKNWRPVSLLNCDYKIAAKAVATRMKRVLPDVINNDQTGFLKGRSIGENVRLLNSVISYAEQQNVPGMLLFIDFEKAFDTLEWKFLEKTLCFYNFGDSLTTWIKLLYTDISSSIQNNGWSSEFF